MLVSDKRKKHNLKGRGGENRVFIHKGGNTNSEWLLLLGIVVHVIIDFVGVVVVVFIVIFCFYC